MRMFIRIIYVYMFYTYMFTHISVNVGHRGGASWLQSLRGEGFENIPEPLFVRSSIA